MTRSDDSGTTRPISVAELLARNGTIGSPPVGGRRRRRRGNADAVTVAELTGEIPVIRDTDTKPAPAPPAEERVEEPPEETSTDAPVADESVIEEVEEVEEVEEDEQAPAEPAPADEEAPAEQTEEPADDDAPAAVETVAEADEDEDDYADAVAAYAAQIEQRLSTTEPPAVEQTDADAEHMSPDPLPEVEDEIDSEALAPDDAATDDDGADDVSDPDALDAEAALELDTDLDDVTDLDDTRADTDDELPSYLRSTSEPLFGGPLADVAATTDDTDPDEADLVDEDYREPGRMSSFVHALWIVGQSIFAVAFGAGLFIAFDQLWKWNNIVALVLSVLVILGLVVAVRVVRKTEDIGSTLIAVAVGALVTLGPLALLQSG
ncbi:hypothetical protein ACAG25_09515 [Mycobacterium sp. pV006]|uniref:hypothetical protein n=1 Tax=Mycobacterium sp. pV006 TaxID=3238983 RepID=UPI00351B21A2